MSGFSYSGFEEQNCINCYIQFMVPKGFTDSRRSDQRQFYCPNGHPMSYRENELDIVRRERDQLKQQMAQKDDEIKRQELLRDLADKQAERSRKEVVRLKKRASAGICPCCNRSFGELAKHMATKHPEFCAEEVAHENVVSILKGKMA